jgi:hypothetical protein
MWIQAEASRDRTGLDQTQRAVLAIQDLARGSIQMLAQKAGSALALQAADDAGPVPYKVGDPILAVGWDRMKADELELNHIKRAQNLLVRSGDVAQEDMAVFSDGPHPAEAGDRIAIRRHAGDAHSAEHLGHSQDQYLLPRHRVLREGTSTAQVVGYR